MNKNTMKFLVSFMVAFFVGLFLFSSVQAKDVTLAWDPNNPAPDGYRLYQRVDDGTYVYGTPVTWPEYPDGNIPANVTQITITGLGVPNQVTTYYWVVRAYVGDDTSGDSNEVFLAVDQTLVAPDSVEGTYDKTNKQIALSWTQPSGTVTHWKVFYTFTSGQDYVELDMIDNTGQATPSILSPFTAVSAGDRQTVYFAIVAFNGDDIFSSNSAEVAIDIDRRLDAPVQNLRVNVVIPVE